MLSIYFLDKTIPSTAYLEDILRHTWLYYLNKKLSNNPLLRQDIIYVVKYKDRG